MLMLPIAAAYIPGPTTLAWDEEFDNNIWGSYPTANWTRNTNPGISNTMTGGRLQISDASSSYGFQVFSNYRDSFNLTDSPIYANFSYYRSSGTISSYIRFRSTGGTTCLQLWMRYISGSQIYIDDGNGLMTWDLTSTGYHELAFDLDAQTYNISNSVLGVLGTERALTGSCQDISRVTISEQSINEQGVIYSNFFKFYDDSNIGNVVNIDYPANEEIFNDLTGEINISTAIDSNCSINSTSFDVSTTGGKVHTFTNNTALENKRYNLEYTCNDGSEDTVVDGYFIYDTINPIITTNDFSIDNVFFDSVEGSYTISDANLFSVQTFINGNIIANLTGFSDSIYNHNISYDMENLTIGMHNISTRIADGHTTAEIPYWNATLFDNETKELEYFFDTGSVAVAPEDDSNFDFAFTYRDTDRYKFIYSRESGVDRESETFIVDTPGHPITYLEDSEYSGHLIIESLNKWIDFEVSNSDVDWSEVEYIDSDTVKVTVHGLTGLDEIYFESIGELNVVWQNDTFYKVNYTIYDPNPNSVLETQEVNFLAAINLTQAGLVYSNDLISQNDLVGYVEFESASSDTNYYNQSGNILYNITMTAPLISEIEKSSNGIWRFSSNTEEFSVNTSEINISQAYLGECNLTDPTYNTTAIQFNIFNEKTEQPFVANLDLVYNLGSTINATEKRESKVFYTGDSTYRLCIAPADRSFYLSNTSYTYYTDDHNRRVQSQSFILVSNDTQQIDLYLINESDSSNIILGVVDELDQPLSDHEILILRYYSNNDSFTQVEQVFTDFKGEAGVKLIANDVFYKFLIKDENSNLLRTVDSFKIFQSEYVFKVQTRDKFGDDTLNVNRIQGDITYTNASKTFTMVYSAPTGLVNEMCLRVDRTSQFAVVNECNNCLGTDSGSINCVVNVTNGNNYRAYAYLDSNTEFSEGLTYTINELFVKAGDFLLTFKEKGNGVGLFISLLFMMTIPFMSGFGLAGLIISTLITMLVIVFTGFTYLSFGAFTVMLVIGMFVLWRSRD